MAKTVEGEKAVRIAQEISRNLAVLGEGPRVIAARWRDGTEFTGFVVGPTSDYPDEVALAGVTRTESGGQPQTLSYSVSVEVASVRLVIG